ncbi:hypothetical protein [Actinomadura madurae]|uniref:hypothetical protein n=1 Tax=Actinomadura madurae TaxID=1993 RepID=UPI002026F79F|nr:hypothetical protein [Actinomadura madurae]MCP9949207.1 hypothetical protein [Actinomadura madurae]MCP9965971.1 hypothetical protein [Actinomadura madurae]MCP9978451.1 hypothetical protein [Actinomadura madurae]MCQ0010022.1 hypothetical protein [Actinomadura madurae]MCQ0014654.1 hypothetical protein [Actinomadura madurae]
MIENDSGEDTGSPTGREVRRGRFPFAVLTDKSVVMAEFSTTLKSQGPGWGYAEVTDWTLTHHGHPFRVTAEDEKDAYLPISDHSSRKPLKARPSGPCEVVTYYFYKANHYGSISGDVTLSFDPVNMTVDVRADFDIDLD